MYQYIIILYIRTNQMLYKLTWYGADKIEQRYNSLFQKLKSLL